jgi:hypothetical protein
MPGHGDNYQPAGGRCRLTQADEHQSNQDQPPADDEHPDIDDDEWRGFPDSDVEEEEQEQPCQLGVFPVDKVTDGVEYAII